MKARKRNLASKIESVEKKLAKMGPENKELMKTTSMLKEHRAEMESLKIEVMTEEAAIGDFKRRTSKEAMGLKCGGMLELAEKLTIVAEMGKAIIDEISLEPTKPGMPRAEYQGHARTDQLLSEATRSLADVGFAPSSSHRPDLSHHDTNYGGAEDDTYNAGLHSRDTTADVSRGPSGAYPATGDDDAAAYDAYSGANTYNSAADYSTTPIYASHQTTQPWLSSGGDATSTTQREQEAANDRGPTPTGEQDDWGRAADAAVSGAAGGAGGSHQSHSQGHDGTQRIADDLPDPSQPWRNDGAGNRSRSSSYQAAAPARGGATTPPPTEQMQNTHLNASPAAPSLPPLRATTPLPGGGSGPGAMAAAPSTPSAQQQQALDDESYFAAVGSTRAAQAAARRPTSPQSGSRYSSMMPNSGSVSSLAAMGATAASQQNSSSGPAAGAGGTSSYEPADSGRKMTAAAFRKGFNRNASGQQQPGFAAPSPMTEHPPSFSGGASSSSGIGREGTSSPAPGVAPLAIRKRHSAVPDDDVADDEAVPPYAPGGREGEGMPQPYYGQQQQPYPPYSQPAYGQPVSMSMPGGMPTPGGQYYDGSQPGSAHGHQQQQQAYGAPYAAGPH